MRRLLAVLLLMPALAACDGDGDAPRGATAVFTHGVASGDATADSIVLWTRADGGDHVVAEVARDGSFEDIERSVEAGTGAGRDYTVLARVDGLESATRYAYRFRAGDAVSPAGAFVTAPEESGAAGARFVFSGDSDGSRNADGSPVHNNFEVLDAARAEGADFFLYFGDTIYADRDPEAFTLDEYRAKYRQNREYEALAALLAAAPVYAAWDDHEVVNDFAGETVDRARFDAGRQAFQEYLPMALDDPARMYRSFRWGAALELIVLDERSFRSASAAEACGDDPIPAGAAPGAPEPLRAIRGFAQLPAELPAACFAAIDDPARTMLGAEQKAFLLERLRSSGATWKVVVNSVPVQALAVLPYDRWEGYAAERRAILDVIRDEGIANVVFLTTDFHANIFGPVSADPFIETEPVAYEAIAGPIATTPLRKDIVDVVGEDAADLLDELLTALIGVDCAELDAYAYGLVEVDAAGATMTITAKDEQGNVLCATTLEAE